MGRRYVQQGGYVALMAVLIVGAGALAIASGILLTATDSQRLALVSQQSTQARSLAGACAEEALQKIQINPFFLGTNNLTLGQGACTYTVEYGGGKTRLITATGTVDTVVRRVQAGVTIGATTATISSWQEVGGTPVTVAHVQSTGVSGGAGTGTSAASFVSNVTAGNLIVASATWDTTGGTVNSMTCTDNRGNAYVTVNTWIDITNTQTLSICYAPNAAAGATTVTATYGTGSVTVAFRSLIISEYSGVSVAPLDVSTGVGGASGTTAVDNVTSGAATTTAAGDLIYGAVMDTSAPTTIAAGTGFSQRFSLNAKDLVVQDLRQAAAGSIASTQTLGAASRYDAAMVAFRAQVQ